MPDLTRHHPPSPANDEEGWRGYAGRLSCSTCNCGVFKVLVDEHGLNHLICDGCHLDYTDDLWNISK